MRVQVDADEIEFLAHEPAGWEERALLVRAAKVELVAKRLVHVDDGELRASITTMLEEDAQGRVAYVGSEVPYAIYQELEPLDMFPDSPSSIQYAGWPRVRRGGKPYLRPALYSDVP